MMDKLFKSLSDHVLNCIDDSLTNDEYSSDDEMIEHFINVYKLTREQATKAVSYRHLYFVNAFNEDDTPLRQGLDGYIPIRFSFK